MPRFSRTSNTEQVRSTYQEYVGCDFIPLDEQKRENIVGELVTDTIRGSAYRAPVKWHRHILRLDPTLAVPCRIGLCAHPGLLNFPSALSPDDHVWNPTSSIASDYMWLERIGLMMTKTRARRGVDASLFLSSESPERAQNNEDGHFLHAW